MNQEKFGELIKSIRKEHNLTQKELADKLGVTFQAVSKWENGKNLPDIAIIKKIAEEFSIDLSVLFEMDSKKVKKKYILIGSISFIVLILFSILLCIYLCFDQDFHFKEISTTCSSFTVYGSIAYNKEKSSMYISTIDYCGEEDSTIYQTITCTLYEKDGENRKVISRGEEKQEYTLNDYLKSIDFRVNGFIPSCKSNEENHLFIEIVGSYADGKKTAYEIPLIFNECVS